MPPAREMRSTSCVELRRPLTVDRRGRDDGVGCALEVRVAILADAAHAGFGAERNHLRVAREPIGRRCAELLREGLDAATLGRVVAQAGLTSGDQARSSLRRATHRDDLGRQPIAEGDRPRLVQQQHVHIARRLDSPTRHGQHIEAGDAIHTGDADRRQQTTDCGRDQAYQQRDKDHRRDGRPRIDSEWFEGSDGEQEYDRQTRKQDRQCYFVGRLLADGAFDQGDHAVEERFARIRTDLNAQRVADHLGATGHAGTDVSTWLLEDGRGFAGDGRLVDIRHAFDHLAVARDDLVLSHHDNVTLAQVGGRDHLLASVADAPGWRLFLGRAQGIGLGFAARFGHRLGEVGEHDGEPQPQRDLKREADIAGARGDLLQQHDGGDRGADLHHEHHRVSGYRARVQFSQRLANCGADKRTLEQAARTGLARCSEFLAFVRLGCARRRRDESSGGVRIPLGTERGARLDVVTTVRGGVSVSSGMHCPEFPRKCGWRR